MDNSNEFNYDKLASVGNNVFISQNTEFRRPHLVRVGSNVAIDSGFYITTGAHIGNFIHIGPYVTCIGGDEALIVMEDFTTIAAGSRLVARSDEHLGRGLVGPLGVIPAEYADVKIGSKIILKKFASVGTNSIIFPGVTLNEGSVIGAGSLVTHDTEPWTVYVGSPARAIKRRESALMKRYGEALSKNL